MNSQFSLNFWWEEENFDAEFLSFHDIIVDRKSRYSVSGWSVKNEEMLKKFMQNLKKDSYFEKATHNSYAYRIVSENGAIIEWKNDDGETGAGMCILRELQRANSKNIILVVTRYFWWIHLQNDRYKHVIDASKYFLEKI